MRQKAWSPLPLKGPQAFTAYFLDFPSELQTHARRVGLNADLI